MRMLFKFSLLLTCAFCFFIKPLAAQPGSALDLENHVKSGLIYNFLKYTVWPEDEGHGEPSIHVCLLGGDPFAGALNPLDGKTAQQKTINIHAVSPDEFNTYNCHAVFVHRDFERNVQDVISELQKTRLLTISDIKDFARHGGMVEMGLNKDGRIGIVINKSVVDNANIEIQNRLLKLAEVVE